MQSASDIRGTVTLQISDEDGRKTIPVPDPEELPRGLPLSPSHKHILRFIRDSIEPCPTHLTYDISGTTPNEDSVELFDSYEANLSLGQTDTTQAGDRMVHDNGTVYRLQAGLSHVEVKKVLQKVSKAVAIGPVEQTRMYRFHERNQRTKNSPSNLRKKRLKRSLRSGNPFKNRTWKCCARYSCFKNIGDDRCYEEYKSVNAMNPKQAKRYLISLYDQVDKCFRVRGKVVGSRFLAKALGFSNDVQCSIKNTPKARGSAIAVSRPREIIRKTKRVFIASFIKKLAKHFGDAMPHKDQIKLPVLSRKELWKECLEEWKSSGIHNGDEELSKSYFYRIWRAYVCFVSVCKNHGFTVCSRCEMLREEMSKHLRDEETMVTLIDQHASHLRFIEQERNAYEARQALAEQNPGRYCSIIVDGADQKNYGLPHFARSTKSDSGHKIKIKVVGVLEHVLRGKECLSLFAMTEEYETGSNHIVEVVHQTLQRKKDNHGKLPPILFVQVDNCIRENKNRYFMAYFQSLVHLGVFKTVQISFLPIGHTHADIDQTFSSISTHLKINDAVTLPDLLAELEKCYARRVSATELQGIINYSGLCDQTNCLNSVDSFTEYRYFRFVQKDFGSDSGLHGSECDVKVRDCDAWVPFPTSRAEGFLKFVPNFGEAPDIVTKELLNKAEVTKSLNAAEERVKDHVKIQSLRDLQEKIFRVRQEPCHWMESYFELNGDYASSNSEMVLEEVADHVGDSLRPNFGYDPDDFVAIATDNDDNTRFWIARVKNIGEVDAENRAKTLTVRWYVASGKDPWEAKYNPAWKTVDGEQTVYEDEIDVASVLVRFENLTTSKRLRVRDRKAIKQTLNEN